jgi:hypothetical protein
MGRQYDAHDCMRTGLRIIVAYTIDKKYSI